MKTNVYRLRADVNHFQNITPDDETVWSDLEELRGQPAGRRWRPISVHIIREGRQNKRLPAGDFPGMASHLPTFSPRAKDALEELLKGSGEWLPLVGEEAHYWTFNVTDVRDALDVQASDCLFFDDGTLMQINRCSFIEAKLDGAVIFRLRQLPMGVYVTETFVDCANSAGLLGFRFVPTWE
jgi:hypothetical protein